MRAAPGVGRLRLWWVTLRPGQWIKNLVVMAAYLFALGDRQQQLPAAALWRSAAAMLLFCLISSGVYILNDLWDIDRDRAHPRKRLRPLAAGQLHRGRALGVALAFLGLAGAAAWLLSPPFFLVGAGYVGLQALYTLWLKHLSLLDVFVIASGFVLRALAGAVTAAVRISPWLLLCTFLLALFLALCKRRHEKAHIGDGGHTRGSLAGYELGLLDLWIGIVSAATVTAYAIYTLWPDTVAKFGTHGLAVTIPFVLFGIFRYLELVYRHAEGERPEHTLFSDLPLLATILLYGAVLLLVMLRRSAGGLP